MPAPQILSVATTVPSHQALLEDVAQQAQVWVSQHEKIFQAKVDRIFQRSGVSKRYTTLPLKQLFEPMTLTEKNEFYRTHIVNYTEKVLIEAIEKADIQPEDLDCLIVASCTGHMSPSLESFLVNRLELKPSIQRLPVMEMGCIGGAAGLMYAENYCRAYPDKYVAVIAAELTSITFQQEDFSWANIVSTAIFGDGIACVIMGGRARRAAPRIRFSSMYHFPNTANLLGYNLTSTGFRMVLDSNLPSVIRADFMKIINFALQKSNWALETIDEFLVHPGGLKILSEIETLLNPLLRFSPEKQPFQLRLSRQILQEYGNMSSATLFFILKEWMDSVVGPNRSLMAGFGPGLSAGVVLLEAGCAESKN